MSDLRNLRFSWRTYCAPRIKAVAAGSQLRPLPMGPQRPTDRTPPIPVVVP